MSANLTIKSFAGVRASPGNPNVFHFRTADGALLTNTPMLVFGEEGNVVAYMFRNPNINTAIWVSFFDVGAANLVTLGTSPAPAHRVMIPGAIAAGNPGQLIVTAGMFPVRYFKNGLVIAAVATDADSASGAPGSALYAELQYCI